MVRKVEELTRKVFQSEFPRLRAFFMKLAGMSKAELDERDQLGTFWSTRVWVQGQVLEQYVATLAILNSQPATSVCASRICVPFNLFDNGCCKKCCTHRHKCLFCGKDPEDSHLKCKARDAFHGERAAFERRFRQDPLDPHAPGIGEDDENLLASLRRLARDPPSKRMAKKDQKRMSPETSKTSSVAACASGRFAAFASEEEPEDLGEEGLQGELDEATTSASDAGESASMTDAPAPEAPEAPNVPDVPASLACPNRKGPAESAESVKPVAWSTEDVARWLQALDNGAGQWQRPTQA